MFCNVHNLLYNEDFYLAPSEQSFIPSTKGHILILSTKSPIESQNIQTLKELL
jgi:hypothetical protein